MLQAWDRLCSETEAIGSLHVEFAEIISTERKSIKDCAKDLESFHKEVSDVHKAIRSNQSNNCRIESHGRSNGEESFSLQKGNERSRPYYGPI